MATDERMPVPDWHPTQSHALAPPPLGSPPQVFQAEVFEQFLAGSSLAECYAAVGAVANRWLDMLDTQARAPYGGRGVLGCRGGRVSCAALSPRLLRCQAGHGAGAFPHIQKGAPAQKQTPTNPPKHASHAPPRKSLAPL